MHSGPIIPDLPFQPQSELESSILSNMQFQTGLNHGRPRPGHPEGAVKWHIAEVLKNVEHWYIESEFYSALRIIALIHDTFKYQVDRARDQCGENHHAMLARRFAEAYISDAPILEVIELHDEAYNAWQNGSRDQRWDKAEIRIIRLLNRLGETRHLYHAFYYCDNATGDKQQVPFEWFNEQLAAYNLLRH